MTIAEINPFIRFADLVKYQTSSGKVYVRDCRIFYISAGCAEITIDNQHYKLSEDSMFYCQNGSVYEISSTNGADILAINFDLTQENKDQKDSFLPQMYNDSTAKMLQHDISDSPFLKGFLYIPNGSFYKSKIKAIITEFQSLRILSREKTSSMLKTLICEIHQNSGKKFSTAYKTINKILDYINHNLNLPITNNELAILANYHEYHLNRLFLQTTGLSIHQYIIKQRIEEAKRLLQSTELSVSEISEQVGFQTNAYFSRYFKESTNYTPLQYRKTFKSFI